MKKKLLLLALCLALCLPASAIGGEDWKQGRLSGLTAAEDGSLLVTDTFNKVVWRVEGDTASRYAGTIGAANAAGEPVGVYLDSTTDKAFFTEPWDISPFLDGYAVSDTGANVLRYIAKGRVQTLAGSGDTGSANGSGKAVTFNRPTGLTTGSDGALYVADTGNGTIRRVDKNGMVSTIVSGLSEPTGLCWSDGALYVVETGRSRISRVVNGKAEPFAGVSEAASDEGEYLGGYVDGPAATARFEHPQGIAAGPNGALYVSDTGNSAVRMISDGRVYTLARSAADKLMPASPRGLLLRDGVLYVADAFSGDILKLTPDTKSFTDVTDQWYAPAVTAMVRRGIAGGMSEDRFMPGETLSRAMFVTMLSRMHQIADGSAIVDGSETLPDIEAGSWYASSARWALDQSIVTGSNGLFDPARNITREEMATLLYRYTEQQGLKTESTGAAFEEYPDAMETSYWAVDAMRWACEHGIVNGSDGRLEPKSPATRAQAAALLLHYMDACSL